MIWVVSLALVVGKSFALPLAKKNGPAGEASVSGAAKIDPEVAAMPGFEDWWGIAQEQVASEEYKPSLQQEDAEGKPFPIPQWHLVNRANGLRNSRL